MKLFRILATVLFDLLDRHFHQNRISNFIRKENINLDYCIDAGAHSGFYTDLILKLNKNAKILLFEPQLKYFRKIEKKYKDKKYIEDLYPFQNCIEYKKINSISLEASIAKCNN